MKVDTILNKIFKAYDVRGVFPEDINEEIAYRIGAAFASFLNCQKVIIGRDMRISSPDLYKALSMGIMEQGVDVVDIGLVGSEVLYYASGKLDLPGIMITASHNPKEWNGMKFCKAGAVPIGEETGLSDIKKYTLENLESKKERGKVQEIDIMPDYAKHALSFIKTDKIEPLKIVIDAGNGMAGKLVDVVYKDLPCKIIPLYFELDGSFPHHQADPIKNENIVDLQIKVQEEKANFGIAFDGDADRVFFIDENAKRVPSALISSAICKNILAKNKNEQIIYNVVSSHIVPETIKKYGGKQVMERVGHSFIKNSMKKTGAIFGSEHSAHYYYRDNYRADSGLITSLIISEILSMKGKPMSEVLQEFNKYYAIEETNTEVGDKDAKMKELTELFRDNLKYDIDGVTFWFNIEDETSPLEKNSWWFNVRPSNTEPVLRLNLEAGSKELMKEKAEEILKIIRS